MSAKPSLGAWVLLLLGATACSPAPRDQATGWSAGERSNSTFTSDSCGITFSHPADWIVLADSTLPNESCRFSLRPRDWAQRLIQDDSVDAYGISIRVAARGVWTEAPESGFERRGDHWVVLGRHGMEVPADTVSGEGWRGIRGTATIGCFREGGGYMGLCEVPTAVIGTESRSAAVFGASRSEDIFDHMLATLRFR